LRCGFLYLATRQTVVQFDAKLGSIETQGVNRDATVNTLPTILYEGTDTDGIVRDGAFRAGVSVSIPSGLLIASSSIVAAFFSKNVPKIEERVAQFRILYPLVPVWIIADADIGLSCETTAMNSDTLVQLVNVGRIRKWLQRDAVAIERAIRQSVDEREARNTSLKSRRELGTRNRQLHDLQENLEKIVTERTSYLSDAERELHRRAQSTRDLVRFIKELSQTESIEEILVLLNQEIRSFHEVRSPILAAVSPEFGARLHFQQTRPSGSGKTSARALEKGWGSRPVKKPWSHRPSIRIGDVEDQTYLAQELGRPVARTIAIPLGRDSRPSNQANGVRQTATPLLIFEHSFDEAKAEKFKRFLISRLEPLSTALDRVIINREMHAASRLWEATFDGIADPIAVIGSGFEILRMNEAFARFPMSARRKCFEVFNDRTTPCDGCRLKDVVDKSEHLNWQVRRVNNVYDVNGYPIRFESETIRTVIHHYADVTKSLELKGHAFQGEKMAAIGLMAGNIAHELNNPLAGLRSLAQVLSVDPLYPQSVKNDLKEIETAAERSSAIIRDLMEFSKADDRVRETVSLNVIAERSLNMVKTALHEHSVDYQWAESNTVMVKVDPHLLQHVIFNVVNNACQAMREPGEIVLRTRRVAAEIEMIEIEVSDTGPGIPKEILARVFEPFFTTKAAGQGTGLGLSMSRWVVENFGGVIEVRNRVDRSGTIFTVRLPSAGR
jgi:two-component system NtrC family sensor kinase